MVKDILNYLPTVMFRGTLGTYIRKTSDNSWKQIPQKSLFEPLNIERQEHQEDQERQEHQDDQERYRG